MYLITFDGMALEGLPLYTSLKSACLAWDMLVDKDPEYREYYQIIEYSVYMERIRKEV